MPSSRRGLGSVLACARGAALPPLYKVYSTKHDGSPARLRADACVSRVPAFTVCLPLCVHSALRWSRTLYGPSLFEADEADPQSHERSLRPRAPASDRYFPVRRNGSLDVTRALPFCAATVLAVGARVAAHFGVDEDEHWFPAVVIKVLLRLLSPSARNSRPCLPPTIRASPRPPFPRSLALPFPLLRISSAHCF